MRAPAPYRAQDSYLDQEESKDQTLEPDRAVANDNGSSTPPAPKPYQPPTESVSAARPVQTTQAPTFSQMQAAGEARPPMPESAPDPSAGLTGPMSTLSGDWQAPTASAQEAAARAALAQNAPEGWTPGALIGTSDGTTRFQNGQVSGGTFEEQFARSQAAAEAAARERAAQKDDERIGAEAQKAMFTTKADGGNAFGDYVAGLTPEQRTRLGVKEEDVTPAQRTLSGIPQLPGYVPPGQAAGTVPSGPQAYTPPKFPTDVNTAGGPQGQVAPGSFAAPEGFAPKPGGIITTQTGGQNTGPSAAPTQGASSGTPSSFDILGTLMKGAGGQGAGSEVQSATQQSILEQLKNPSAYGSKEVQDAYGWLGGNIDDEFALREKALKEDMVRRGLSDSTINAGNLKDLNIGRRSAKEAMGFDLAQQLAKSKQSATGQAISQGLQGGQSAQNAQLDWLRNLIGYGQQGFENDMSTAKFNASQDQDWRDFLTQMLGAGYAGGG